VANPPTEFFLHWLYLLFTSSSQTSRGVFTEPLKMAWSPTVRLEHVSQPSHSYCLMSGVYSVCGGIWTLADNILTPPCSLFYTPKNEWLWNSLSF
jgi:hypothetical protein